MTNAKTVPNLCECGCGLTAARRFFHGHNRVGQGKYGCPKVVVDDLDADLLALRWSAKPCRETVYASHNEYDIVDGVRRHRNIMLHRVIMQRVLGRDIDPSELVDHRNGNGLDNRRRNLRLATSAINAQNRRPRDRQRGVSWHSSNRKWAARGGVNRKMHHIGYFDTPELAAAAASKWRAENMPGAIEA